jgi:hypothetical protein
VNRQKKPWWYISRTRRQSLVLGLLMWVLTAVQVSNNLLGEPGTWWQWALAVLMFTLGGYQLLAWRVRGARESQPSTT